MEGLSLLSATTHQNGVNSGTSPSTFPNHQHPQNQQILLTPKKKMTNFYLVLEEEKKSRIDIEDTDEKTQDSYNSYTKRETDFCKDSSDSSFEEEEDDVEAFDIVEYEVETETETESQFSDSSSGTNEHCDNFITAIVYGTTTTDFADSSDSSDSQDSELTPADFWRCIKCNNQQNNPMFRYCEKCYQIKKTHFPPPPKTRKRRHHKLPGDTRKYRNGSIATTSSLLSNGNDCKNISFSNNLDLRPNYINEHFITKQDFFTNEDEQDVKQIRKRKRNSFGDNVSKRKRSDSFSECYSEDLDLTSAVPSNFSCQQDAKTIKEEDVASLAETVSGDLELSDGEIAALKASEIPDEEIIRKQPNRNDSLIKSFSLVKKNPLNDIPPANNLVRAVSKSSSATSDSSTSSSNTCIFCLTQPKNAVFVHSSFVHLCSCYKCAVKIFNKNKRCPICNGAVKNVLQLYAH